MYFFICIGTHSWVLYSYGLELEPKEDSDLFGILFAETASWHKALVVLRCPVLT